jgi:hypothetical protein
VSTTTLTPRPRGEQPLDAVRRGTAAEMVTGIRRLLEQLVMWLAEIEVAASGLTRESLPPEGAELLAHLEAGQAVPT